MIYIVLLMLGILSAIANDCLLKKKMFAPERAAVYFIIYLWLVNVIRAITSSGKEFLTFSLSDKEIISYAKVALLAAVVFCAIRACDRFISRKGKEYEGIVEECASLFSTVYTGIWSLYCILIGWPTINASVIIGSLALLISVIVKLSKNKNVIRCTKWDTAGVIVAFAAFDLHFLLTGPIELISNNKADFIYSYSDTAGFLIIGAVLMSVVTILLIVKNTSARYVRVFSGIIMVYCVSCYVQEMFLNGDMSYIDGGTQMWSGKQMAVNAMIWIAIAVVTILAVYKYKNGFKILTGICAYVAAIQLITFIYLFTMNCMSPSASKHLTEERIFDLAKEDNVIVFILDAYDVQMMKTVIDNDEDYLEPLHDFVYFNNMSSRYTATDGSLPYLLTAADLSDPDIKKDQDKWYDNSVFLKTIKDYGYDIRILTSDNYVEDIQEHVIDNYSDDGYCKLDAEKTVSLFERCMKYKNSPFCLKSFYRYEAYDITNVITDTNIYIFGTDPEFDEKILAEGVNAGEFDKAFRIYHLYGAHSPYYLTQDAKRDYDSNALAQWRGSLKIVYDYIDALKEKGIYDDATIIIMADHGFNNTQRNSVAAEGIPFDENKTNPIFFIKEKNMSNDRLTVDSRKTSHDSFFDTVYESMGIPARYYGTVFDE